MLLLEKKRIDALQRDLLDWFQGRARPLPWRQRRTTYGTWVAEIMLQQTTVAVVEPYWLRFMARFPTVQDLAAAPEQEVLQHWSGLGYYSRARNLHQAARVVAEQGRWPVDREGWRRLPGVGDYTSAAVVSQALGHAAPALDANARRVLTRWLVDDPARLAHLTPRRLEEEACRLVPVDNPGTWNEAVMELGALVCGARQTGCTACPVLDHCAAGLAGRTAEIPARRRRPATRPAQLAMLTLRWQGRLLLTRASGPALLAVRPGPETVRSDFRTLHRGLWSLPATPWYEPTPALDDPALSWAAGCGPELTAARQVGNFDHAITRFRLRVGVFLLDLDHADQAVLAHDFTQVGQKKLVEKHKEDLIGWSPWAGQPAPEAVNAAFPLSSLARKALACIGDNFS